MLEHYVYAHLEDGEPVYIGIGKGGRAWSCGEFGRRNKNHSKWMNEQILNDKRFVQIIASKVSRDEAISLEKQLIEKLNTRFNIMGTNRNPQWKSVKTPLGEFKSISEAARAHGVTQPCISYKLKRGVDGYEYAN